MTRFMPLPASAHAGGIDLIMTLVHGVIAVVFLGWLMFFLWSLIRFRASRHPRADTSGLRSRTPGRVEIAFVAVEVVLLAAFAIPAWTARTPVAAPGSNPLVVRGVAEQFMWHAHYPGADGRFGETRIDLVTPANPLGLDRAGAGADDVVLQNWIPLVKDRPVLVQLSSKDVIHSFGLPNFRVKMDATPGMLLPVSFTPTVAGRFDLVCSQLCGLGHYRMRAIVEVFEAEAFARLMREDTTQ